MTQAEHVRLCGHPHTPENTVWRRTASGGTRSDGCKTCRNQARQRADTARRRAAGAQPRPSVDDLPPGSKRCARCQEIKPLEDFSPRPSRPGGCSQGRVPHCRPCAVLVSREWQKRNPDSVRERNRRDGLRLRMDVLDAYSNGTPRCSCCGETELVFLALDHVDDDGGQHRRMLSSEGVSSSVYRDLRRKGFPPGYQVLCHNCNWAKHMGGCPHQKESV